MLSTLLKKKPSSLLDDTLSTVQASEESTANTSMLNEDSGPCDDTCKDCHCPTIHPILCLDTLQQIYSPFELAFDSIKMSDLSAALVHFSQLPLKDLNPLQQRALEDLRTNSVYSLDGEVSIEESLRAYSLLFDNLFFFGTLPLGRRVEIRLQPKDLMEEGLVARTDCNFNDSYCVINIKEGDMSAEAAEDTLAAAISSVLHELLHCYLFIYGCYGCGHTWEEGGKSGQYVISSSHSRRTFTFTLRSMFTELHCSDRERRRCILTTRPVEKRS